MKAHRYKVPDQYLSDKTCSTRNQDHTLGIITEKRNLATLAPHPGTHLATVQDNTVNGRIHRLPVKTFSSIESFRSRNPMAIFTSSSPTNPNPRLGLHYFPDTLHYREADLQTWLPELQALGVSWLVLQSEQDRAIPEYFLRGLM